MSDAPIRIGKYRILRRLGQGAQGSVYLAQRDHASHFSVVKQRHAVASDLRFRREAQVCALLDHKNIARLEAAVFDGEEAYLAFEYVSGIEVQDLYERHRQVARSIPAPVVLHIVESMLAGLEFAHSALDLEGKPAGLVHRDLNFGNVMIGFDGVVKVIDFGLARNAVGTQTQPGFALGTPAYMPPEFLGVGAQSATPASDVYSVGLMAYDLLMALDHDVSRGDSETFWRWIMNPTPLPPIAEHRSDVSPRAAAAIHRAFMPKVADRWPSARAFLEELRAATAPYQRMSDAYLAQYLGAGFKERILAAEREQELLIASEPGEATGIQAVPSKSAGTVKMGVVSGGGGMEMASSETPAVEQTPVDPTTLVVKRRSSNPAPKPVSITPPNVERLGKYSLLRLLAEGGMGRVYLARRDGADEICVLKTLRPDIVGDDVTRRRFIREAQLAALLHHDNIARLLDAGFEGGTFCIALEYIPGKDLESMMHELYARRRLLPFPVSVSALIGVLDGLDHAHRVTDPKGRPLAIVHRDLSPRNMMLTFEGVAKVIDFGVARASLDDFKTAPGMVMGTFRYVSPEMARAEAVDHRSDIYAAGVVLYELLSGFPVVPPSKVAVDMLRSVVSGAPQPLHEVATQIPVALSEAIAKAMQKKPADRWQTAAEFRAAIVTAVPEWAHTPKSVLSEFLRTWFKDDAKQAGAIVELSHLAEPAERTRTFVLDDAVEPTAVVPMAEFAEVEELLATKTGLVFPEAPEPTRSVVIERTVAVPTRIIDARSQPEQPAHVSVRPSPPSAPARWKGPALIGLGMVLMLAIQVIYTRVTAVPERSVVAVESPAPSVVAASPVASPGALPVLAASPSPTFSPVPTHSAAPIRTPRPTVRPEVSAAPEAPREDRVVANLVARTAALERQPNPVERDQIIQAAAVLLSDLDPSARGRAQAALDRARLGALEGLREALNIISASRRKSAESLR